MILALLWLMGSAELENGLKLHYQDEGTGEVIVLIGGLGSRLQIWEAVAQPLKNHYRVIRPDNRGIGKSGDLQGVYTTSTMAEDIAGLMRYLKVDRYHVVGISLGSFAAQALALQEPKAVASLTLIASSPGGSVHIPPDAEVMGFFQKMLTLPAETRARTGLKLALHPQFIANNPKAFEAFVQDSVQNPTPPAVSMRQAMAGLGFDHSEKAQAINQPTLLIHGENDRVVPPENGKNLAKLIPNSHLKMVASSGHLSIIDQPQTVVTFMLEFLGSL